MIRPLARLIVEQRPSTGDLIRLDDAETGVALTIHRVREPTRAPRAPRPAQAPADATLARAAARAQALLGEILAEEKTQPALTIGAELSGLLAEVNDPGFWDDPASAKAILARVYQLQRVTDGVAKLRNRGEGLVELAQQLRSRRDRGRLGELRNALGEVEDRLAIARLEVAGAAAGEDEPEAVVTFVPVGAKAESWADELLAMYEAWAERTGRDATRRPGETRRLTIVGPGSYPLLAAEAGLHRRDLRDRRRQLARVQVDPSASPSPEGDEQPGDVVRVYADAAHTRVRDPRTGVSVGNLRAVLDDGQIDEFILAGVRLRQTLDTTDGRSPA